MGASIDPNERAYFGLFPNVDHFNKAVARWRRDFSVKFTVNPNQPDPKQVTITPEMADELTRYINQFERVYRSTLLAKWSLLYRVADPVERFKRGARIRLTTMEGKRLKGRLLYLDEDVLVLSRARSRRTRLRDSSEAVVVFPRQIKHIQGPASLFRETNVPQAGDKDLYLNVTLPQLKEHAALRDAVSPEIYGAIQRRKRTYQSPESHPPVSEAFKNRFNQTLHLSVSLNLATRPPFSRYAVNLFGNEPSSGDPSDPETVENNFVTPNFGFSAAARSSIIRPFGLEAKLDYVPSTFSQPPKDDFVEYVSDPGYLSVSGWYASALMSYNLHLFEGYDFLVGTASFPFETTELLVQAGPSVAFLSLKSHLSTSFGRRGISETNTYRQQAIGASAALKASVYLSRLLSIDLTGHLSAYPSVEIEESSLYEIEDYEIKEIEASSRFLVLPRLSLGLSSHF